MKKDELKPKTLKRLGLYGTMNDTCDSVVNRLMDFLNPDYVVNRQIEEEWPIE